MRPASTWMESRSMHGPGSKVEVSVGLASTGNPMLRIVIATTLLLGAGSIAGAPATSVIGKALAPAPQSRAEAVVDIDDATAAALIGAISSQFGERAVQVRLGRVQA